MWEFQIIGNAFLKGRIVKDVVIHVSGEFIKSVSKRSVKGVRKIRVKSKHLIMPATIDLHVHLRDWRQSYKEDVETGTSAAIVGGCTTVVEMPNTDPPIDSALKVRQRLELLSEKSLADFNLHVKPPKDKGDFKEISKLGVVGIKLYPEDLNIFNDIQKVIIDNDLKLVVHAEFTGDDEPRAVRWLLSCKQPSLRLRFAHISRRESVEILAQAKRSDENIKVEVTPHHILLDSDMLIDMRAKRVGCVKPSLASKDDREAIYKAVKNEIIDFIATDHAPHTIEDKMKDPPAPGFPGLEIALPLMITEWVKGNLNLSTIVRLMSENPAKYLGIAKGRLSEGYYADITVVDLKTYKRVIPQNFISKAKYTPFEGRILTGWPTLVMRRGEILLENSELISKTRGKHITNLKSIPY